MASRAELERRLTKLDADIPEIKRRYPVPADFIAEFAGHADHITDDATGPDANWAFDRVDALLEKHGFSAGPDDSPPDE